MPLQRKKIAKKVLSPSGDRFSYIEALREANARSRTKKRIAKKTTFSPSMGFGSAGIGFRIKI